MQIIFETVPVYFDSMWHTYLEILNRHLSPKYFLFFLSLFDLLLSEPNIFILVPVWTQRNFTGVCSTTDIKHFKTNVILTIGDTVNIKHKNNIRKQF